MNAVKLSGANVVTQSSIVFREDANSLENSVSPKGGACVPSAWVDTSLFPLKE